MPNSDTHVWWQGKYFGISQFLCMHRRVIKTENQVQRKLPAGLGQDKGK